MTNIFLRRPLAMASTLGLSRNRTQTLFLGLTLALVLALLSMDQLGVVLLSVTASSNAASSTTNVAADLARVDKMLAANQFRQALEVLDGILANQDSNTKALYKRATVNGLLYRTFAAIADWKVLLSIDPSNNIPHLRIADLLRNEGRFTEALKTLDTAIHNFQASESSSKSSSSSSSSSSSRAKSHLESARSARKELRELIETEERFLAREKKGSKDHAAMASDIDFILARAPRAGSWLRRRASFAENHQKDAAALMQALVALVRIDPSPSAYAELANLTYSAYYDVSGALAHARRGARLDPEHKGCRDVIRLLRETEAKISGKSSESLARMFSALKSDFRAWAHIGLLRATGAKWCEAQSDLRACTSCVEDAPGASLCAEKLARLHAEQGDIDDAIQVLKRALNQESIDSREKLESLLHDYERELHQNQQHEHQQQYSNFHYGGGGGGGGGGSSDEDSIDYYKELEVKPDASHSEIKKSFHRLAKIHHPDGKKDPEEIERCDKKMRRLNQAKSVLLDEEERKNYDARRAFGRGGGGGGGHHFQGAPFFASGPDGGIPIEQILRAFGNSGGKQKNRRGKAGGGGQQFFFQFQ